MNWCIHSPPERNACFVLTQNWYVVPRVCSLSQIIFFRNWQLQNSWPEGKWDSVSSASVLYSVHLCSRTACIIKVLHTCFRPSVGYAMVKHCICSGWKLFLYVVHCGNILLNCFVLKVIMSNCVVTGLPTQHIAESLNFRSWCTCVYTKMCSMLSKVCCCLSLSNLCCTYMYAYMYPFLCLCYHPCLSRKETIQ